MQVQALLGPDVILVGQSVKSDAAWMQLEEVCAFCTQAAGGYSASNDRTYLTGTLRTLSCLQDQVTPTCHALIG